MWRCVAVLPSKKSVLNFTNEKICRRFNSGHARRANPTTRAWSCRSIPGRRSRPPARAVAADPEREMDARRAAREALDLAVDAVFAHGEDGSLAELLLDRRDGERDRLVALGLHRAAVAAGLAGGVAAMSGFLRWSCGFRGDAKAAGDRRLRRRAALARAGCTGSRRGAARSRTAPTPSHRRPRAARPASASDSGMPRSRTRPSVRYPRKGRGSEAQPAATTPRSTAPASAARGGARRELERHHAREARRRKARERAELKLERREQ